MKNLAIFVTLMIIVGCTGKAFVIPDEPIYKELNIIKFSDGICMENADFEIWLSNQKKLWEHKEALRKLLEEIQRGTKAVEINYSDEIVASK